MALMGFMWVLLENSAITQVNDKNSSQVVKSGATVELEKVNNLSKKI